MLWIVHLLFFFFFNDTATTEIYTLSLHDALPISLDERMLASPLKPPRPCASSLVSRSEEHTSELQSQSNLVCRLLLEKKKNESAMNFLLYRKYHNKLNKVSV